MRRISHNNNIELSEIWISLLTKLPKEILIHILSFLYKDRDVLNFAVTSKYFYSILSVRDNGLLRDRLLARQIVDGDITVIDKIKEIVKTDANLLKKTFIVETSAADLMNNRVVVEGTYFQLALGADDTEIALKIAELLDQYCPGEKAKQYQAQFLDYDQELQILREQADLQALDDIFNAVNSASHMNCRLVLTTEKFAQSNPLLQQLVDALNTFRAYLKPKGVIKTGFHFNIRLLIKAIELYEANFRISVKDNTAKLFLAKVIGLIHRFAPFYWACKLKELAIYKFNTNYSVNVNLTSNYRKKISVNNNQTHHFLLGMSFVYTTNNSYTCYGELLPSSQQIRQLYEIKTKRVKSIIELPQTALTSQSDHRCLVM